MTWQDILLGVSPAGQRRLGPRHGKYAGGRQVHDRHVLDVVIQYQYGKIAQRVNHRLIAGLVNDPLGGFRTIHAPEDQAGLQSRVRLACGWIDNAVRRCHHNARLDQRGATEVFPFVRAAQATFDLDHEGQLARFNAGASLHPWHRG